MKFKLFAVLFALVFSAGIISHETSHFELNYGKHVHNEHAVDLSEDCSTCLAEQIEYVLTVIQFKMRCLVRDNSR